MAVYILKNLFRVIRGEQKLIVASHCEILIENIILSDYVRFLVAILFLMQYLRVCPYARIDHSDNSELNSYFNMSL